MCFNIIFVETINKVIGDSKKRVEEKSPFMAGLIKLVCLPNSPLFPPGHGHQHLSVVNVGFLSFCLLL